MSGNYDQHLACADCGHDLVWRAGEQEFYREKGFEPPERCKDCNRARKERRESGGRSRDGVVKGNQ